MPVFTQLYNVAAFTPRRGPKRSHASLLDSSGPISEKTSHTACSLNSGENFDTHGMLRSFCWAPRWMRMAATPKLGMRSGVWSSLSVSQDLWLGALK